MLRISDCITHSFWSAIQEPTDRQHITDQVSAPIILARPHSDRAASYRRSFRGNWPPEPSLRIVRLMNEVVPVFSGSGSLPSHVGERQISIVSSSFPIAHNCQIKEPLLDGFDLRQSFAEWQADQKSQST